MKKLIQGIVDFRNKLTPEHKQLFSKFALEQKPNALFISCSDSRVAVNVFASTNPGDLFVVRNVGNIFPPSGTFGLSVSDESEAAALEFALTHLKVKDIIVCGHSECGAMIALCNGRDQLQSPHLKSWLGNAKTSLELLDSCKWENLPLSAHNRLSQLNVLQQLENLKSYELVKEKLTKSELRLHGWWFDIAQASVFCYDSDLDQFVILDENQANRIYKSFESELPL